MIESHESSILPHSSDKFRIDLTQSIRKFHIKINIIVVSKCPYNNVVDFREYPAIEII